MKKAAAVCYKICLYLAFAGSGIIFLRSLAGVQEVVFWKQTKLVSAVSRLLVPAVCFILAAMLLFICHYCKKGLQSRKLSIGSAAVILLAQVSFLLFVSHPMYTTDTLRVQNEAIAMLRDQNGMINMETSYFQQYPNNHVIVICFYYYFKVLSYLGITDFGMAAVVFNAACIDSGILLGYLAALKLRDQKLANLYLLLCMANPATYAWLTFAYTNTVSIPFVMGILYLFLKISWCKSGKRQFFFCFVLGACIAAGWKLRPTTILPVIAAVLCIVIKAMLPVSEEMEETEKEKPKIKTGMLYPRAQLFARYLGARGYIPRKTWQMILLAGIKGAMILAACLAVYTGVSCLADRHVPDGYEEQAFPASHWIMMGLNEKSGGGFIKSDVNYTKGFHTKEDKTKANMREIRKRLLDMGISGFCGLMLEKIDRVWAEGSDTAFEKASFAADYPVLYPYIMGRDNLEFRIYTQGFRGAAFFFISICILFQIKKEKYSDTFVFTLTLLGCIAFFLLWEANSKYNICFMPVCLLLMAEGIQKSEESFGIFAAGWMMHLQQKICVLAVLVCVGCVETVFLGIHYGRVERCELQYVYRAEMQDRGLIGKELLEHGYYLRQTIQKGQDCEKNGWNRLSLAFHTVDQGKTEPGDCYHAALFVMPEGELLYEADISRDMLDKNGRYTILKRPGYMRKDSYYVLELYWCPEKSAAGIQKMHMAANRHSMYPRLQKSGYLDMYPYGELTIDGSTADYDLCMELYYDAAAY